MLKKFKKCTVLCLSLAMLSACSQAEPKKEASLQFNRKEVIVTQGSKVNAKDYVKKVDGDITYPKVDTSKVGKQDVKYEVVGEDGKKKSFVLSFIVEESKTSNKVEKEEPTQKEDTNKPSSDKKEDSKQPSTQPNKDTKPTQQPTTQNTTSKPNTKPSVKPQPNTPSHTHNWVAQYKTIHHDAQGHNEKVCVKEAYDEQVPKFKYEIHELCNICNFDLTANKVDPMDHSHEHIVNGDGPGGHHDAQVKIPDGYETIHHDAVYENKWVVDKEAYDEKVLDGYKCSSCGAKK